MQNAEKILRRIYKHSDTILKYHNNNIYKTRKPLSDLEFHQRNAYKFLSVSSPAMFCRLIKTNFYELQDLINNPVYIHFRISKKKAGYREISAPDSRLKKVHKKLNYYLQAYYLCIKPDEVTGFIINPKYLETKHDIIENARMHVGKKYILNIDLKDFFSTISAKRVKDLFSSDLFYFDEQITNALTLLTTYNGKLPTGAPTSPVISNFLCLKMDQQIKDFCISNSIQYSRYADDLTFSSNTEINQNLITEIIKIIKQNRFEINEKKLRVRRSDQKQVVTGIVVNEKVNVDRKLIRKVRAIIHDIFNNGLEAAAKRHLNLKGVIDRKDQIYFKNKIEGYIRFIGQVRGKEDAIYNKLISDFNKSLV
jgi:RNA-directed DNA polymerase